MFQEFESKHPLVLVEGVDKLIKELQDRGTDVYLVSGGMRIMIDPVAEILNIPLDNIRAQTLFFDEQGNYNGFCTEEPTCRAGGKEVALSEIRKEKGYKTIAMVGDGATDMEAKNPGVGADLTVGFGGVIEREITVREADWFVYSFDELRF